jgi:quercetin dioxygenase-like cupin family protein
MTSPVILYRWDDVPLDKVTEMVARKAISSAHARLTQAYLKKGAIVPLHAHPSDLFVYVLQGAIRARVDGEDVTAREGEVLVIPAGLTHQAESLDDSFVLTFVDNRAAADRGSASSPADGLLDKR